MRRPGPLHELPLEDFLPSDPNSLQVPSRPVKRPLSPGVPKLLSPAKRRIVNEQGLLISEKAESSLPRTSKQSSPSRFADVLNGPGSPAKVLDFGLPKPNRSTYQEIAMDITPRRPMTRSMSRLVSNPELNPRQSSSRHIEEITMNDDTFDAHPFITRNTRSPVFIPRDLPLPQDPHSTHYPGFEVYQDPYTIIFPPLSASQPEALKDEAKENVPSRRKGRKTSYTLEKPESNPRSEPTKRDTDCTMNKPSSPKKIFGMYGTVTSPLTSRRLGMASLHVSSPISDVEMVKRERKLKMMEEVDEGGFDVDDDDGRRMVH
ncbi:hypothetical protein F5887DRAFT_215237 [Amanita rubescens]|nr:hypothetical protein F5887DRAFT_215237 [Amanita rubescens]